MEETKSIPITKRMVWNAYKKVKRNGGSAGVDFVEMETFDENLSKNLYKLWNRLSSGSYFPLPVKEVEIPKKDGKVRKLGIPTIGDRIAQTVVKDYLEERFEKIFHPNSFGYRPRKSAHNALDMVRKLTWKYSWVVDLDISKFFDTLDHELLLLALNKHVPEKWAIMYIVRWLNTPVQTKSEGLIRKCGIGTPQGGVISPLLANLYLHYAFDAWITKKFPYISFVRYADDIVIHCESHEIAVNVLESVKERLNECRLTAHPEKTKLVYCKDCYRLETYPVICFDFLGYTFKTRSNKRVIGTGRYPRFDLGVSRSACMKIIEVIRNSSMHKWSKATIEKIADYFNPKIRGWIAYYGKFRKWNLAVVFNAFHLRLAKWALHRYKLKYYSKAILFIKNVFKSNPNLFVHWTAGFTNI